MVQMCPLDIAPFLLPGYLVVNPQTTLNDPILTNLLAKSKKYPSLRAKLPIKQLGIPHMKIHESADLS